MSRQSKYETASAPMSAAENIKSRKRELIKLGSTAAFFGLVAVFVTIAWFTMNKDNSANGMGIKVGTTPFELAVPDRSGAETYYNSQINAMGYLTGTDELSTDKGSIRWVMRDESPAVFGEDYKGFRPGSYGRLIFYIIPKSDANAIYDFQLKISGYYAEFETDNNNTEVFTNEIKENTFKSLIEKANGDANSSYALAADYLKGHIMFFQNHKVLTESELNGASDSNSYYSGRIVDTFTYNTAEHQADKTTWNDKTAYQVEIYWIWPNTFSQIVLDSDSENLYGDALFSSKQSGTLSPRNELISFIADHPGYYFGTTELAGSTSSSLLSMMSTTSLNTTNALLALSNGYNAADQVIGENVQFILVELVAEQSSTPANQGE